jgi:glycerol-3-phosphate O-acyltransferase
MHFRKLRDRIRIEGDLDTLRSLADKGTFIVAPTHLSNMDSVVVGWALAEVGLPPVTYGAGKNLFTNAMLSYFMHNLGAYKVDRRISHNLYKECLKTYSEELLVRGFHSLFFPGGTRSRSGQVEDHLKLGLLGTGLTAYLRKLKAGQRDKLFLVPMTLNFNLVLEAEGLIHDYMRAVGREYYLLPDDPFDSPMEVLRFGLKLAEMETSMVIRFGEPLDILGNRVDAEGRSYDKQGREVDLASYMEVAPGVIAPDPSRDREYTREAGEALAASFVRNTVVMPTQFVSKVLFSAVQRRFPSLELAQVMRFGKGTVVPWEEVNAEAGRLRDRLRELASQQQVRLFDGLERASVPELIDEGLRSLGAYHSQSAAEATGQGVVAQDMNLLFYYSNRLACLEVEA